MYSIRCVLIFLAVAGLRLISYSQNDNKKLAEEYLKMAEEMKEGSNADNDIREVLVMAATADPTNLKANFEAGAYHLKTLGKDLAAQYLMRVYEKDKDYKFNIEYLIGQSYQFGLEFDKAIEFYTLYKNRLNAKPNYAGKDRVELNIVDRNIYECQNGKEYVADPKNYSIVNVGPEINSEWEDYAPMFDENEGEIVFTTRRKEGNLSPDVADDNRPWEDIFTSNKKNDKWLPAKNIGPVVNSPSHDSNLALSADGKTLFIFKDKNGGDIYFSQRQGDDSWSEPAPLPGVINSADYEEKSVTITKDQKTLYFSSDRPGGYGGLDLYKATKNEKGEWGNVKNLGKKINTEFDDDGPFIGYDSKTLYFSSRGHKGMGGFDIFKSAYDEAANEWSDPENLGYPINTPDNDIYYVTTKDGKRAYYSSVREDGVGYDDIYMIIVPEPVAKKDSVKEEPKKIALRYVVQVVDAQSKKPIIARARLQGLTDNIILAASTKGEGTYEFKVTNAKDYRLSVEAEGFMFVNETVKLDGAADQEKVITRTIELKKLQTGLVSVLRNIYFDFDRASFKQDSYNELSKLQKMMQQNPRMFVEISGHTDGVGAKNYNKFLSQKRAEAVKDFLTKKGIDSRRVIAMGYGAAKPLASNDDEREGRELNRRVEFKVVASN